MLGLSYALVAGVANVAVAYFGPVITPVTACLCIAITLVLRDLLHQEREWGVMAAGIFGGAAMTATLSGPIAVASVTAFLSSSLMDTLAFALWRGSLTQKRHVSNALGAVTDSCVFTKLAFGQWLWGVIVAQVAAKVCGAIVVVSLSDWVALHGRVEE